MNKKILLTMLLVLVMIFSVSAIQASDVNITDSDALSTIDDEPVTVESSSDNELESVNSNTLSTNNEDASLMETDKNQTEITSQTTDTYYKGSYSVTLKDSNSSNVLANKTVNLVINNVKYNVSTDSNGVARFDLSLNPGKYSLTAYFEGDDSYSASNNFTATLNVLSTIKANDITKYYKGSTQYSATFLDSNGNVLANRYVTITVNGKSYNVKTDGKGVAKLSVNLKPGTYKVVSTDPITGYKLSTTFKILSTISATATTKKVAGDSKKFTATFLKSNGKALANKYIKIKLKGKTYKVKTNSKGKATLSLKSLKKGTYKVICYNKDGLSKTFKIKVYGKVATTLTTKLYTFLKSDKKTIKVTLKNSLGYAPTSGKIIKIKINGKTYTKKTNSKGVVYLKLPSLKKGVYTVKYKFGGASHYKASSASNKVIILSTKNAAFTVKSTTSFGYGAGTQFKVAVTAGGVPLIKRTVTFDIDGKTYTGTTNSKGIASIPINLNLGNYTIKYSIKKESKVNAKSGSSNINVFERSNSMLTWKSGTSFTDSSQTFKVLLTDINGKAISGQTIKLTIKSKTYTATTASNGYATFKTSAPIGTYTVSVKFGGSNNYISSSTSQSVSITFSKLTKGVNEKNTISDLSAYLKSSSNCQVGNAKIKSLVNSLTSGLTSDLDKANAIFNYVRDTLSYSFYYNTKFGATGTLSAKKGNCVDHTHLLVAMFRTANLEARYVHGKCTFTSGSTYGHVWAQVLIGNTWVCADATSSKNSLGKISNWNTKTFTLKGTYASLPF
ncbi:transglutaminase domain-containing protein [Methanobrevibacter sp.]|uniref:transglutaminase domain-containing protein n=1 Tax=Methanobrevibacter sp. TaxID=66852 RepID=UPI0025DE56BC|nr:transglutaminase domain-containing protein [Methanobrevibacter sp.]